MLKQQILPVQQEQDAVRWLHAVTGVDRAADQLRNIAFLHGAEPLARQNIHAVRRDLRVEPAVKTESIQPARGIRGRCCLRGGAVVLRRDIGGLALILSVGADRLHIRLRRGGLCAAERNAGERRDADHQYAARRHGSPAEPHRLIFLYGSVRARDEIVPDLADGAK